MVFVNLTVSGMFLGDLGFVSVQGIFPGIFFGVFLRFPFFGLWLVLCLLYTIYLWIWGPSQAD